MRAVTTNQIITNAKPSPGIAPFGTSCKYNQASHLKTSTPLRPGLVNPAQVTKKQFADYDLAGKVYIVTGGAQGLGLTLAEALVEAGGKGGQNLASHSSPTC
jgi:hypothetical protein